MVAVATFNTKPNSGVAGNFQAGSSLLQGSGSPIQGSGAGLQGSSPSLQVATNPMNYNLVDGAASQQATNNLATGPSAAVLSPLLAALDALGIARDTSNNNAQSDYQNTIKQYNDLFGIDQTKYNGQVTQNEQNLTGNRQAALLQAAQGGQGLRAVLAAMGALNGTGSILADRAIGQAANKDIGDAQNTFETNASSLQGAWADTEAQDKQRRAQADAALRASQNANDTSFYNNKIDILGKLANAYGANTGQGANYANEAASLYGKVAAIPQGQAVSYTPVSNLYNPQNLASYLAGTNNLQVQTQPGSDAGATPSVVATVSKRKDELS